MTGQHLDIRPQSDPHAQRYGDTVDCVAKATSVGVEIRFNERVARMRTRLVGLPVVAASVLAGCSSGATPAPTASPTSAPTTPSASAGANSVTVYAAASLTAAFKDLAAAYQAAHTGVTVTLSFDSSATLETQIEQGAPADVFASADTTNPKKLVDKGLAAGSLVNFAGNILTIIIPGSGAAAVTTPMDLGKSGVKVVAAGTRCRSRSTQISW